MNNNLKQQQKTMHLYALNANYMHLNAHNVLKKRGEKHVHQHRSNKLNQNNQNKTL